MILRCTGCDKPLKRPLFFIVEKDEHFAFCGKCIIAMIGEEEATSFGGWEMEIAGDTYLTKVRR